MSLDRFVEAQASTYAGALAQIRRGAKRSHGMWFIFPQLIGLGSSATARFYGIHSIEEARACLKHPLLRPRYVECVEALQDLPIPNGVRPGGCSEASIVPDLVPGGHAHSTLRCSA